MPGCPSNFARLSDRFWDWNFPISLSNFVQCDVCRSDAYKNWTDSLAKSARQQKSVILAVSCKQPLKGEVSRYHRPVWLVWNQLYKADNFCFYFQNRLIQTGQTGRQWYSDTSPFSIPCLWEPKDIHINRAKIQSSKPTFLGHYLNIQNSLPVCKILNYMPFLNTDCKVAHNVTGHFSYFIEDATEKVHKFEALYNIIKWNKLPKLGNF